MNHPITAQKLDPASKKSVYRRAFKLLARVNYLLRQSRRNCLEHERLAKEKS